MCGILAYIYDSSSYQPSYLEMNKFRKGLDLMEHRGPDKSDLVILQGAVLGHRRLSILDLAEWSNQPFFSDDRRYSIVYNGEIFNYLELRLDLQSRGVVFKTESDTEVLLQSYVIWGKECLAKLNGMFAFIVYDSFAKSYFAARDNFGIKPLYYISNKHGFIFSSEIKPLLLHLDKPVINEEYLSSYFIDSSCDYGTETLIAGIGQIGAGCYFSSCSDGRQIKWFDLKKAVESEIGSIEPSKLKSLYASVLKKSVDLRLRSDVPLAITLSAGMDSSSIYSIIKNGTNQIDIAAYTIGKEDSLIDSVDSEFQLVNKIVEKYSGKLEQISPPYRYTLTKLYESIYRQEFPTWSLSTVLYDHVYKTISKRGIKVLLEGHGNDEILGGYPVHISTLVYSLISQGKIRLAYYAAKVYQDSQSSLYYSSSKSAFFIFLVSFFQSIKSYLIELRHRTSWEFRVFDRAKSRFSPDKNSPFTYFQNSLINDVEKKIVPTVLRTFDRSTMGASIEMRPPFMDPKLVILSLALPDEIRIGRFGQKSILRDFMVGALPDEVVQNRVKKGFTADIVKIVKDIPENEVFALLNIHGKSLKINEKEFRNCYSLFLKNNDWQLASIINRVISALIWCDLFIEGNWKKYEK